MKYAILKSVNGNFTVDSEWSDINSAIVGYHGICRTLWNEPTVIKATVEIANEDFDVYPGYREFITHEQVNE